MDGEHFPQRCRLPDRRPALTQKLVVDNIRVTATVGLTWPASQPSCSSTPANPARRLTRCSAAPRALTHQEIAGSEHDVVRLLLFALDRNKAHARPLGRF